MAERRGPKPTRGVTASARVCVRLTDGERSDLARVARENHTNVADVIREAVNEYVSDYRERPVFETRQP